MPDEQEEIENTLDENLNIRKLQALVEHLYRRAMQTGDARRAAIEAGDEVLPALAYIPTIVWGEAGIGKSETVRGAADRLGIGFKDLRLAVLEVGDLIGVLRDQEVFPSIYDVEAEMAAGGGIRRYSKASLLRHLLQAHPDKMGGAPIEALEDAINLARRRYPQFVAWRSVYSTPDWFPDPGTHGILFLDEINRARREVLQAVFQLVLDRELHGTVLPAGWIILAAANPQKDEDEQGATVGYLVSPDFQDRALLDRFLHVGLRPDPDEWLEYAAQSRVDPTIRATIANDPKLLTGPLSDTVTPTTLPTPRSWMMLNRILPGLPKGLVVPVSFGLLGRETAIAWLMTARSPEKPVTAKEVLKDYPSVLPRILRLLQWKDEQGVTTPRNDLLRITFEQLSDLAFERDFTPAEFANFKLFYHDVMDVGPNPLGLTSFGMSYMKFRFSRMGSKIMGRIAKDPFFADILRRVKAEGGMKDASSSMKPKEGRTFLEEGYGGVVRSTIPRPGPLPFWMRSRPLLGRELA